MLKNRLPALTIFLGSFLIFGVQPMLGRTLLPAFGGTAAVWTTCLATYQVLLLAGYFYAHKVCRRQGTGDRGREGRSSKVLKFESSKVGGAGTVISDQLSVGSAEGGRSDSALCGQDCPRSQGASHLTRPTLHIALLGLGVVWMLGFAMGRPWLMAHVGSGAYPALEVLLCVLAFAGLPYLLLSANSTLVQAWVAGGRGQGTVISDQCSVNSEEEHRTSNIEHPTSNGGKCGNAGMRECANEDELSNKAIRQSGNKAMSSDVYALYAVSNAGSLLGLLCYPFLVEPFLSLDVQWYGFAGCLGVYAGLLALLARRIALLPDCHIALLTDSPQSGHEEDGVERPALNAKRSTSNGKTSQQPFQLNKAITQSGNKAILWLVLPATSTFLLNAVTAHLSTDVTPIPLLWVALLAAFLLSYIIGFSKVGEKGVLVWCVIGMAPLLLCAYATGLRGGNGFLFNLVPGLLLMLFGCTFLHGWLYSIRPEPARLTRFYLCLAAGGALGGLLSGIVAPLVFTCIVEYPFALVTLALFSALYAWRNTQGGGRWLGAGMQIAALAVISFICQGQFKDQAGRTVLLRARNFYGCLTVSSQEIKPPQSDAVMSHRLQHGETLHGVQFRPDDLREKPTTYYGAVGGGLALLAHPSYTNNTPMQVGLIGLGAGTMACWGRTNDTYRFFEINPEVVDIAWNTNYFSYLSDAKAKVSVALGDARRVMTVETNRYDVLVIDAYSGDAIPFHLATKEAFQLYFDRLNPGGILAVHISNWHIDLNPLCKAVAKAWGLQLTGVISQPQGLCMGATWVFICDRPVSVEGLPVRETDWEQVRDITLPTDACGSLINLVQYRHEPPEKPLEVGEGKF